MKQPTVYIMASQRNGTLYVGVTSNLVQRVWQHKNHVVQGFTEKYHVELLVWFEQHESMDSAISREKAVKKWLRRWKLSMIEKTNPDWTVLWPSITGEALDSRLRGNDDRVHLPLVVPVAAVIPANPATVVTPPTVVIPALAGIQKVSQP